MQPNFPHVFSMFSICHAQQTLSLVPGALVSRPKNTSRAFPASSRDHVIRFTYDKTSACADIDLAHVMQTTAREPLG